MHFIPFYRPNQMVMPFWVWTPQCGASDSVNIGEVFESSSGMKLRFELNYLKMGKQMKICKAK